MKREYKQIKNTKEWAWESTVECWGEKDLQKKLRRNTQGRAMLSRSVVQLFCNARDCSPPGSSVQGIFSQEYWSWLSFPTPGDLPDPGIEPASLASSSLAGRFFTIVLPRKANMQCFFPTPWRNSYYLTSSCIWYITDVLERPDWGATWPFILSHSFEK